MKYSDLTYKLYELIQKELSGEIDALTYLSILKIVYPYIDNVPISKISDYDLSFLSEAPLCKKCVDGEIINGVYRVVADITTAQYIDYQKFVKQTKDIPTLLTTLLTYNGHKYCDPIIPKEEIENLSIEVVLGLSDFFFQRIRRLNLAQSVVCKTEDEVGFVGSFFSTYGWELMLGKYMEWTHYNIDEALLSSAELFLYISLYLNEYDLLVKIELNKRYRI